MPTKPSKQGRDDVLAAIEVAKAEILGASKSQFQRLKGLFKQELGQLHSDLQKLADAIEPKPQLIITGGDFMFVLPDDQPDVPFSVSPVSATDAEGNAITLTEELVSDNEAAVAFAFADGSSATNPRAGVAKIGSPGVANVNYTAKDPKGNIVKSSGSQFTITTGAVANVSGGDIAFQGITEQ